MGLNLAGNLSFAHGSRFEHVVFRQRARARGPVDLADRDKALGAHERESVERALSPAEYAFICWLFDRAGLDTRAYRHESLRRRLPACLRALHVNNMTEARRLLLLEPAKIPVAVGALIIGVTAFFRDANVFDHLTLNVLPALPRPPQRRRIWSAGCSDGAEIYSIAMLLADLQMLDGVDLFATDCRASAIARTREAVYDTPALRDVPHAYRERYFTAEGRGWRVVPRLRAMVRTRVVDVTRTREPGLFDLILCRNMAMYFRASVAAELWQQMEMSLRPGGFLVLGKAERPSGASRFTAVAPCIYRRH